MKFRVERDVLAEAVAWAARSLPARPPVPVLAGLMLDASDGRLVLSSFDYEVSARVEIAADINEPGVALVSGRLLADISRSLPDRPVEVTTDASKVVLTCGSSRFTLLTLPVDDYPALPEMPGASGSLRGDVFASAVGQVSVAAMVIFSPSISSRTPVSTGSVSSRPAAIETWATAVAKASPRSDHEAPGIAGRAG